MLSQPTLATTPQLSSLCIAVDPATAVGAAVASDDATAASMDRRVLRSVHAHFSDWVHAD